MLALIMQRTATWCSAISKPSRLLAFVVRIDEFKRRSIAVLADMLRSVNLSCNYEIVLDIAYSVEKLKNSKNTVGKTSTERFIIIR